MEREKNYPLTICHWELANLSPPEVYNNSKKKTLLETIHSEIAFITEVIILANQSFSALPSLISLKTSFGLFMANIFPFNLFKTCLHFTTAPSSSRKIKSDVLICAFHKPEFLPLSFANLLLDFRSNTIRTKITLGGEENFHNFLSAYAVSFRKPMVSK